MTDPQDEFLDHRELSYAAKMTRSQDKQRTVLLIIGPITLAMIGAVIWLINQQIHHYDLESVSIITAFLLLEAFFAFMTLVMWSRKLRLNKKRQTVTGLLKKITIRNSNGPDSESYYIGDCQILWPMEAGLIREQDVGRQVSLSGAMINIDSTLNLSFIPAGRLRTILNLDGTMLIVLNYQKGIDISRLLRNYGVDYFQRRFQTNVKKYFSLAVLIVLLFSIFMYLAIVIQTTLLSLTVGVGGFIVSVLGLIWVLVAYDEKIDQWLDKHNDYGSTTHVERLSGKVSPTSGGS
ncbi:MULTISPECIES: hypothetical protein [Cobetia]|uniref:hypothetical protein n=1 Tax=Cobetia TaxID=204286 RepID=UPI00178CFE55|nr:MULTISPECIES: hypothetical protein [Cobetia]MBE2167454.1 hypothetical protein [Cobetia sp. 2AS1]MDH2421717.1 hypothetical protein [Cobetia litoralis]MDH2447101.1 hypothetical protein [Cobetia sp. 2AS]